MNVLKKLFILICLLPFPLLASKGSSFDGRVVGALWSSHDFGGMRASSSGSSDRPSAPSHNFSTGYDYSRQSRSSDVLVRPSFSNSRDAAQYTKMQNLQSTYDSLFKASEPKFHSLISSQSQQVSLKNTPVMCSLKELTVKQVEMKSVMQDLYVAQSGAKLRFDGYNSEIRAFTANNNLTVMELEAHPALVQLKIELYTEGIKVIGYGKEMKAQEQELLEVEAQIKNYVEKSKVEYAKQLENVSTGGIVGIEFPRLDLEIKITSEKIASDHQGLNRAHGDNAPSNKIKDFNVTLAQHTIELELANECKRVAAHLFKTRLDHENQETISARNAYVQLSSEISARNAPLLAALDATIKERGEYTHTARDSLSDATKQFLKDTKMSSETFSDMRCNAFQKYMHREMSDIINESAQLYVDNKANPQVVAHIQSTVEACNVVIDMLKSGNVRGALISNEFVKIMHKTSAVLAGVARGLAHGVAGNSTRGILLRLFPPYQIIEKALLARTLIGLMHDAPSREVVYDAFIKIGAQPLEVQAEFIAQFLISLSGVGSNPVTLCRNFLNNVPSGHVVARAFTTAYKTGVESAGKIAEKVMHLESVQRTLQRANAEIAGLRALHAVESADLRTFFDVTINSKAAETIDHLMRDGVIASQADLIQNLTARKVPFSVASREFQPKIDNFSEKVIELYKFSNKTIQHMNEAGRSVPVQMLDAVIKNPMHVTVDPRGSNALMYYSQITRDGKLYNIEVLYNRSSNEIWHFKYSENALGPLPKIR